MRLKWGWKCNRDERSVRIVMGFLFRGISAFFFGGKLEKLA